MNGTSLFADIASVRDCDRLAQRAFELMREIFPICRSITGDGVRSTLQAVQKTLTLEISEVPSGTQVFDWTIPPEWNIRDAYIANGAGKRVVDFQQNNLHVVSYSVPVRGHMTLEALRPHLHSLPLYPDWIPYRTTYYARSWGFCLTHRQLLGLADIEYEVVIDSELRGGSLTYAECRVPGRSDEEVLVHTHTCHPSMANDNVTGIAVAAVLAAALQRESPALSYRFVFAPGTIGSIAWLACNQSKLDILRGGLVIGLLGDRGPLTYKRSRRATSEIDHIASAVVQALGSNHRVENFTPYGYDERQFCSPGFDLPVGRLTRSANGAYPQYHTSADNLSLVDPWALAESIFALVQILRRMDANRRYKRRNPHCEPRLGRHRLYRDLGGAEPAQMEQAMLWLLNQADGCHGIQDVSAQSGLPARLLEQAAEILVGRGLLTEVDGLQRSPAHAL